METLIAPSAEPASHPREERVLILMPKGREAQLAYRSLTEANVLAEPVTSVAELCHRLEDGAGALLIAQEALRADSLPCLVDSFAKEPPWSDLSLIVLTSDQDKSTPPLETDDTLRRLGNVTFLERPIRVHTIVSAVQAALRARRRQYQCRELLAQQQRAVERLDLLADVANHLLLSTRPELVAESVFQKISVHLGLEIYIHYLFDPESDRLRLNSCRGIPTSMAEKIQWLKMGENLCGVVAQQRSRIIAEEVQSSSDPDTKFMSALGITAYACYPLLADDRLIGTLSFGTRQRTKFHREELAVMETVSSQVAVAIQRKRTEEALHELNQALEGRVRERTNQLQESADQMEAFSYSISHDLRAPLRTIRGFSQALLEDYGPQLDSVGRDYLQRLVGGSERMDALIQDLLQYSRVARSKLSFEPIDLESCLDTVLLQFEEEVQAKKAKFVVKKPLTPVLGHLPTLEQAIVNLVSNALKFTEPDVQPEVTIWTTESNDMVRLWIQDNGIGIAPEHQQRIFGVFERLHGVETYPGTGIGLAIVAKAVTRMGGRVGVDSSDGNGSRFWLELPRARAVTP